MDNHKDILHVLDLPSNNNFSITIRFIDKNIIAEWKEKINYLFEEQDYELFNMFNTEYKNKMYDYVNNIKKYYLQYKTNEIELIKSQYAQLEKSINENLYILYQLEEYRNFKSKEISVPTDADINYELNVLQHGDKLYSSSPLFLGLKQNDNFIFISASTYSYFNAKYQDLRNNNKLLVCEIISEDKVLLTVDNISTSKFYITPYNKFITKQLEKKYKYTLCFDSVNYLYLIDNLTRKTIRDKEIIKNALQTETSIVIDSVAQGKYNITQDSISKLAEFVDDPDVMFYISLRGKNIICLRKTEPSKYHEEYLYIEIVYVKLDGYDYEHIDTEDKKYILNEYLQGNKNTVVDKKSFCLHMNENKINEFIQDQYKKWYKF